MIYRTEEVIAFSVVGRPAYVAFGRKPNSRYKFLLTWPAACSRYPFTDTTTNIFSVAGLPAKMAGGLLTVPIYLSTLH